MYQVTYYEERMQEMESELGQVKEERHQASHRVSCHTKISSIYTITNIILITHFFSNFATC